MKYCKLMGHVSDDCYRLHGYPSDFKFNRSSGNNNGSYIRGGESKGNSPNVRIAHGRGQHKAATYVDNYNNSGHNLHRNAKFYENGRSAQYFGGESSKMSESHNYLQQQYGDMVQHIDNPHHYSQFKKIIDKDNTVDSSAFLTEHTDSANMGGNMFTSSVVDAQITGIVSTSCVNDNKV